MTVPQFRSNIAQAVGENRERIRILEATPSQQEIHLDTGESFTVYDSVGNPIFRVDENGDLHGKTGKALTFDL